MREGRAGLAIAVKQHMRSFACGRKIVFGAKKGTLVAHRACLHAVPARCDKVPV